MSLRSEIAKWRIAIARSFARTESGRLLWFASAIMAAVVLIAALFYQWSNFETSLSAANITSQSQPKDNDGKSITKSKFSEFGTWGLYSILSLGTLTVGGSLLAAFLVSLLAKIKWEAWLVDRGRFFALLAQADERPEELSEDLFSRPIDIVVARYMYEVQDTANTERRTRRMSVGGAQLPWKGRIEYNDISDSRAAQRIQAELERLGFKDVAIVSDSDIRPSSRHPLCEILIGLCVNSKVNDTLENMPKPHLFVVERDGDGRYSIGLATTRQKGIAAPPNKNNRYRTAVERDYALIAKVKHHGHVQIIVGGLCAEGTLKASDFFVENLVEIVRSADSSTGLFISSNRFAAVYGFEPGTSQSLTLELLRVAE